VFLKILSGEIYKNNSNKYNVYRIISAGIKLYHVIVPNIYPYSLDTSFKILYDLTLSSAQMKNSLTILFLFL